MQVHPYVVAEAEAGKGQRGATETWARYGDTWEEIKAKTCTEQRWDQSWMETPGRDRNRC